MLFDHDYGSPIIPSGIHLGGAVRPIAVGLAPPPDITGIPLGQIKVEMCNPMERQPIASSTLEVAPLRFLDDLKDKFKGAKEVRRSDLLDYGDVIPEVRKTMDAYRYHAVIVPYRGALKPWLQLSVLAQHADKVIELPFTRASQRDPYNDERLRWYLAEGIAPFSEEPELRLAVVDTGVGGNSSVTMADLLRELHRRDRRRRWYVHLHLIHKRGEYPEGSWTLPKYCGDGFHINPFPWSVNDLIVEDWNAAIGLEAVWDDGTKAVVDEASAEVTILMIEHDKVMVVESPVLHHFLDGQLGQAVSDAVVTHPEMPHFIGDVWAQYIDFLGGNKG